MQIKKIELLSATFDVKEINSLNGAIKVIESLIETLHRKNLDCAVLADEFDYTISDLENIILHLERCKDLTEIK